MLTIKAEIKRSELKVDGTYNVKIRFTLDRKVKRLSTNLFVTQQDLTKSLKFKEDTSIKREIDRLVLYYREQCLKLQLDQNHYSLDEIIEFLNGEQEKQQTIDFIKFSREWIASATIKGAPNYTTAINALVRFVGKEELDINLITLDFLEQFKAFLIGERDARTKKLMQNAALWLLLITSCRYSTGHAPILLILCPTARRLCGLNGLRLWLLICLF